MIRSTSSEYCSGGGNSAAYSLMELISGLWPRMFARPTTRLPHEGADRSLRGRHRELCFEGRVLLVARYCGRI